MEFMDKLKYHKLKEKNLIDYYEKKMKPKRKRIRFDKGEKIKKMRKEKGKFLITFD